MKRIPLVVSGLSLAAGLVLGGGLPASATTSPLTESAEPVVSAGEPLNCSTSSSDPAQAAVCNRAKENGFTHQATVTFPEFPGDGHMKVCNYGGSVRVAYLPGVPRAMVLGITSRLWAPSTGYQCSQASRGEVSMASPLSTGWKVQNVVQDGVYRWAPSAQPVSGAPLVGVSVTMWWNDSLGGESRTVRVDLAS